MITNKPVKRKLKLFYSNKATRFFASIIGFHYTLSKLSSSFSSRLFISDSIFKQQHNAIPAPATTAYPAIFLTRSCSKIKKDLVSKQIHKENLLYICE